MSRGPYLVTIACDLAFDGAVHVGTGERLSVVTDAPVMRDGADNPLLPGSSVRGVLRDWCEREAAPLGVEPKALVRLFGPPLKRPGGRFDTDEDDRQGRLVVCDVALRAAPGAAPALTSLRDHVRIDRAFGAAKEGAKFDREVVETPCGVLTMTYEGDGPEDGELRLLAAAVAALEHGILAFGGHTGSGLGAARATGVRWNAVDRRSFENLAAYCLRRLPGAAAANGSGEQPAVAYGESREIYRDEPEPPEPWAWLSMKIALQFDGPMLVAAAIPAGDDAPSAESEADATYLTDRVGAPLLPGSTLRGVLKSHADRIAASFDRNDGARQVASRLFGIEPVSEEERGHQGLLRVGEGHLAGAKNTVVSNHVAIDRVTGFAVAQRLFHEVALASPRFVSHLFLRWHEGSQVDLAAIALLLITLRDAEAGLVWLGSRTTRGYGRIAQMTISDITHSSLERCEPPRRWKRIGPNSIDTERIAGLAGRFGAAVSAWQRFVREDTTT